MQKVKLFVASKCHDAKDFPCFGKCEERKKKESSRLGGEGVFIQVLDESSVQRLLGQVIHLILDESSIQRVAGPDDVSSGGWGRLGSRRRGAVVW